MDQDKDTTLHKQEIFHQIHSDLMSSNTTKKMQQQTKRNFGFVLLLDAIALLGALVGSYVVYTIFKEEAVQLVQGQDAVKTLQITLLEQLDKLKYAELTEKEKKVQELQKKLDEIQVKFQDEKNVLEKQSQEKLNAEIMRLKKEFSDNSKNKSQKEIDILEMQYIQRTKELEQQYRNILNQQVESQQSKYQQELDTTRLTLTDLEQEISNTKILVQTQTESRPQSQQGEQFVFSTMNAPIQSSVDENIRQLFFAVQKNIEQKKYNEAEKDLNRISNQAELIRDPEIKKIELFLVDIVQEYLNLERNPIINEDTGKIRELSNKILALQNQIEQGDQITNIVEDDSLYQNLLGNIIKLTRVFNEKIVLQDQLSGVEQKEVVNLVNAVSNHVLTMDTEKSQELYEKARENFKKKEFQEAAGQYYQILQSYPNTSRRFDVLDDYRRSLEELFKNDTIITNIIVENTDSKKVKKEVVTNIQKRTEIIYVSNPDGYITDIGTSLVAMLTPQSRLKAGNKISILRMENTEKLTFVMIGESRIMSINGRYAVLQRKDINIQTGDLIYSNIE